MIRKIEWQGNVNNKKIGDILRKKDGWVKFWKSNSWAFEKKNVLRKFGKGDGWEEGEVTR